MMARRMMAALAVALAVAWSGCATSKPPKDYKPMAARFFLEASGDGTPVTLPLSSSRIAVNSKPVLTEGDFLKVDLVQVDLGKCLLFQLTPTATRDFYRLSVTHQGRRLVLVINDAPLGARMVDGPITNGVVYVFAEVPESELPALVDNLNKTIAAVQKEIARKG